MPNRKPGDELVAAALRQSSGCPPIEQLEAFLGDHAASDLQSHLDLCAHCQTELKMLRSFSSAEIRPEEREAVEAITAQLKARSVPGRPAGIEEAIPWWQRMFAIRWLAPAAGALAALLVVAGITVQWRQNQPPSVDVPSGRPEVLRSVAIQIQSPVGDVAEKPSEIRWQAVPHAARYKVRLFDVGDTEVWAANSGDARIELPESAANLIVPAKTLLIRITAFDSAGVQIAESGTARFRLLQNVYKQ